MKLKVLTACAAVALAAISGAARADDLIANGGFEDGAYTATDPSGGAANGSVPVDWTPDAAFIDFSSFNHLTGNAHSGDAALSIGDYDDEPEASLSQTFSDVAGQLYTASFYAYDGGANGDAGADLTVSVGAASASFDDTVASYTLGTFSFVGTGSDTLTIAANTNPSEWFVDDVSVASSAVSAAPEPSAWVLMMLGVGGAGYALRRGKTRGGRMAAGLPA